MPRPRPDRPDTDPAATDDRVRADLEALSDLVAAGVEVDGEVQVAESTWALYGHASYDGEVIVGEYDDEVEASAVFRAAPHPRPADDGPVP